MDYAMKIERLSNAWYNDGLGKAQIRDMSGAIVSLRRSLQYNKGNIEARNLLGLVYYGRGEVVEALVEWIISKNFQPRENAANRYIQEVQNSADELEQMNEAIKKYNQSLAYCAQNSEDMAMIQLKRAISEYPGLLKAYQLLALLYLHTGQYAEARQTLRTAKRLDTTNELTLRYIQELRQQRARRTSKDEKEETVEYKVGNETIIQPVQSRLRELAGKTTFINVMIGVLLGAAVVWFLITPEVSRRNAEDLNRQMVSYSERMSTMEAQISAQTRTLDQYRATNEGSEQAAQTAASTSDSYENLMQASDQYDSGSYSEDVVAQTLINVNRDALGEGGQVLYDQLSANVFSVACDTLYSAGMESFNVANYENTIYCLYTVVRIDEGYDSGNALLNLGISYARTNDPDSARNYLSRAVELFPGTEVATAAQAELDALGTSESTESAE